jgi:hypothetical protein
VASRCCILVEREMPIILCDQSENWHADGVFKAWICES